MTEAEVDPETRVVTVYEGRRGLRAVERAARRPGYRIGRITEYVPDRMLEAEVAANVVYEWAARQILNRRLRRSDPRTGPSIRATLTKEIACMYGRDTSGDMDRR